MPSIFNRLKNSSLFKDSFWAVCGNGIGNGLLLIAGIVIARLLGKDVYGEYGVVKTTMLYISVFATLGIGFTSTKYIAQYVGNKKQHIKSIINDAMTISFCFSSLIALILVVFAKELALYLEEPELKVSFQALAAIIIFKALTTTQIGILAGFKDFSTIAKNSMMSGLFMFCICIPLTFYLGLIGSLISLFSSQSFNAIINYISIRKWSKTLIKQEQKSFKLELIKFSLPIALQESSYSLCHWVAIMFLTKLSSAGELGLYTAAAQWNSIILMVPSLLNNVVLSYLSSSTNNTKEHNKTKKRMLQVNAICTTLPFAFVFVFAEYISSFYGDTFGELSEVLRILTLLTIFESMGSVYRAEFMSRGMVWTMFTIRFIRDIILIFSVYILLSMFNGEHGAQIYSCISVCLTFICLITYIFVDLLVSKNTKPC